MLGFGTKVLGFGTKVLASCTVPNALRNMSTSLSLYNSQGILTTLMETRDITVCSICSEKLGKKSYLICKFPDAPPGTRGIPEEHEGHTACASCATDRTLYVGEGGSCKACFDALGGRRAAVAKSGVALIPPVLNSMANIMMNGFLAAEQTIKEAQDANDAERIREGAERRAAAVEEKRRRRAEAAEVEANRLKDEAKAEAKRLTEEAKERAEREAERLTEEAKERAEREAERLTEEAKERAEREAERLKAEAHAEAQALAEEEDRKRAERHRIEDASRAALPATMHTARQRKAQSQETVKKRMEKSRATREAKKMKLEQYDALVTERDQLQLKLNEAIGIAKIHITNLNGDANAFEEEVDVKMLAIDGFYVGDEDNSDGEVVD